MKTAACLHGNRVVGMRMIPMRACHEAVQDLKVEVVGISRPDMDEHGILSRLLNTDLKAVISQVRRVHRHETIGRVRLYDIEEGFTIAW